MSAHNSAMSAHNAAELQARNALRSIPLAADSARVGRTHRVVRERALVMQESRQQRRTLWLPLTIASAMLVMICYAIWASLAQFDVAEIPGELASSLHGDSQMMIIGLWFLPVTATALFFVWLRKSRNRNDDDSI
jgi:hypothetical protein